MQISATLRGMGNTAELVFWNTEMMPDLQGHRAIVTGATSGLGWVSTAALAEAGAEVIMAVRDTAKAEKLVAGISDADARGRIVVERLDLADLASVRDFGARVAEPVHYLLNNAGVMLVPQSQTSDGFETQFGVNHLGHFALTAGLWPQLVAGSARVCTISSNAHKSGEIDFGNLSGERKYSAWGAYAQSKLANLLFAFELGRRVAAAGLPVISTAAHPGYSATALSSPLMSGWPAPVRALGVAVERVVAQLAEMGALPGLYALVAAEVPAGAYVGPNGWGEWRGYPKLVTPSERARSAELAERLWQRSVELTGCDWAL